MTISPWVYASLSLLCALVALRLVLAPPDTGRPGLQIALLASAAMVLATLAYLGWRPRDHHKPQNVSDVNPNGPSSDPTAFAADATHVYFVATDASGPRVFRADAAMITQGTLTDTGPAPNPKPEWMAVVSTTSGTRLIAASGKDLVTREASGGAWTALAATAELTHDTFTRVIAAGPHAVAFALAGGRIVRYRIDAANNSYTVANAGPDTGTVGDAVIANDGSVAWVRLHGGTSELVVAAATGNARALAVPLARLPRFIGNTLWFVGTSKDGPTLHELTSPTASPTPLTPPTGGFHTVYGASSFEGNPCLLASTPSGGTQIWRVQQGAFVAGSGDLAPLADARSFCTIGAEGAEALAFLSGDCICHVIENGKHHHCDGANEGLAPVLTFFAFAEHALFVGTTQKLGAEPWRWFAK